MWIYDDSEFNEVRSIVGDVVLLGDCGGVLVLEKLYYYATPVFRVLSKTGDLRIVDLDEPWLKKI